jgi:hypothetical protein
MYKKSLGFCLLLSCLMLGVIGCPAKNPTSPAATPTPVPTIPPVWSFEGTGSGNIQGWSLGYGGGTAPANSVAVTAYGYQSNYGLGLIFTGTSGDNDMQAQVNGSSQGFPLNFTALNASGVYCYLYFPNSVYNVGPGNADNNQYNVVADPYITTIQAGPVTTIYGGCYNGWKDQQQLNSGNDTGGNWALMSFSPPSSDSTWATNEVNVTGIGLEINLQLSTPGEFVLDDVTIF